MRFSAWVTGGYGDDAYADLYTMDAPSRVAADRAFADSLLPGEMVREVHEERGPGGTDITLRRET